MSEFIVIKDNGQGCVIKTAGVPLSDFEKAVIENADWVAYELSRTEAAALDPNYPALVQVLDYRAALRAYRDSNYEGNRPQLDI